MKKTIIIFIALTMTLAFCACSKQNTNADMTEAPTVSQSSENATAPINKSVDFNARYVRTYGYYKSNESYPKTIPITSRQELEEYYEAKKETYFSENVIEYEGEKQGRSTDFSEILESYDEKFFAENELIFVVLKEPSGSITHDVKDVVLKPSNLDRVQYFLQPVIEKTVPEVFTDDIGDWHIIIELSKESIPDNTELVDAQIEKVIKQFPDAVWSK